MLALLEYKSIQLVFLDTELAWSFTERQIVQQNSMYVPVNSKFKMKINSLQIEFCKISQNHFLNYNKLNLIL